MTWNEALEAFLSTHSGSTADQYRTALEDFYDWYVGTYGQKPEPELLTDEEARDWRAHLSGVCNYAAL